MLPKKEGLTSTEAKKRLKRHGPNTLPKKVPPSDFVIFISQLKNPLVYILVVAGIITSLLGDFADSVIIFFAVFLNTVLGFIQERRASKALQALEELIHPEVQAIRDGKVKTIDTEEIVVGDVIVLNQGSKVPADGKLLEANRLFVTEAILTGESVPVAKKSKDGAFMGTIVVSGRGKMLVEVTGALTQMGKIAQKVQEPKEDTPLRKQLKDLSKQFSFLVFILTAVVFVAGFLTGRPVVEIFTTSVALAVSSIPEGLLVGLTVVLAIGMQRILKRKGLVRNLVSAETLGGVTTICIDKTGTLTKGKLQVVDVDGDKQAVSLQSLVANDLDDPIVIAAWEWAVKKNKDYKKLVQKHTRVDSIPFSSKARFFASLNKWDDKNNMIFVNGAPEFLLDWSLLGKKERKRIQEKIEKLTQEGMRLVGMARKKVTVNKSKVGRKDVKAGLHWIGLIAFSDPVRPGVTKALEKTKKAGLKTLVITGDYPQTAVSVMKRLNLDIKDSSILLGDELKEMSKDKLMERLSKNSIKLFARTTPQQKLKIVEALKKNKETVAMMGDGVNDAPALKRSDIGIVVGQASDVAKETADLILLDSSFATVVAAIEEGRGIFDNVRKIILYLLSDAFEEIVAVLGTLILGLPLPITAGQILWINLISDGLPDLALTIDPKAEGIMQRAPRPPGESLVAPWMKLLIGIISFIGGIVALGLFFYFYKTTSDVVLARSVAFATLGVNSLVFVFSVRTLTEPFWKEPVFANKWLNLAVFAGLFLQFLPFTTSGLREFFGLKFPGTFPLILVFSAAALTFIMVEVVKSIVRKRLIWFRH